MADEDKGGAGAGTGAGAGGAGAGDSEPRIPKDRFDQINNKLKEAVARVATLELELGGLRESASAASGWHEKFKTADAELAALKARHAAHVDGVKAGVTSTRVLEHAYGEWAALPEKDRKAFGETLQVWRQKPDEAPELLRPHFAAGAAGAGAGGGKTPPKAPPANRGAGAPPPPGSKVAVKDLPDDQRKKLRGVFFGG
jgi:hypothetical protein